MNIGILTLSLKRGGAERVAALVSRYLSQKHNVYMILFDTTAGYDYPFGGQLIDLNLPEPKNRCPLTRLKNTLRAVPKLRQLKGQLNLDVMLSFLEPANIPNVLSRTDHCRTILSITEDKSYTQGRSLRRWIGESLIRGLYGRADLLIAASAGAGQTMTEKFGIPAEKIRVIHNPVDLDEIRILSDLPITEPCDFLSSPHGPIVMTVGRLTLPKGQWHLIRAFTQVRKSIPSARLVILGDGELSDLLIDLTKKMGLSDCVFFPGFKSNPFQYLRRAAVFVLSSLWEGFGNVVLESLAVGVPVISTDVRSGPREILAPEDVFYRTILMPQYAKFGVLTPGLDGKFHSADEPLTAAESVLAGTIVKMLSDSELARAYRQAGPIRASDFHADRLLAFYEQAMVDISDPSV
jgi:glycosyltransferase involved in cell wall biosynthesis